MVWNSNATLLALCGTAAGSSPAASNRCSPSGTLMTTRICSSSTRRPSALRIAQDIWRIVRGVRESGMYDGTAAELLSQPQIRAAHLGV